MSEENIEEMEEAVAENGQVMTEESESKEPSLEEQLEAALAEAASNKDKMLRAQAEFANAKKRFEKQRIELYGTATAETVKKLLPVLDDYARAIENVPSEVADNGWYEGILLVHRKLNGVLDALNVEPIEAVGQPFDPNFHEAIMQDDTDEFESGVVTRELQRGYQISGRVIRPALVAVAA